MDAPLLMQSTYRGVYPALVTNDEMLKNGTVQL